MHQRLLKFKDVFVEEQFCYFFLFKHVKYVRFFILLAVTLLVIQLLSTVVTDPAALLSRLPMRLPLLAGLAIVYYFTNPRKLEIKFWVTDWCLGMCAWLGCLVITTMIDLDDVIHPADDVTSAVFDTPKPTLVTVWMSYVTMWACLSGAVFRKKIGFIATAWVYVAGQIQFNFVKYSEDGATGGPDWEGVDYASFNRSKFQSITSLLLFTILLFAIAYTVEFHIRVQFYHSWVLQERKIETEKLLQKQKFSEDEIEIIKEVMEASKNSDIDMELQEVLILSEDLQLEEMIGKGAYGEVFKANYEGIHVAIKVIKDISEHALTRTRAEILLMKGLQHPQIVMFIGACWDEFLMGIVLELVDNGPLSNFLHNKKLHLSWEHPKLSMAKDAAAGCLYLHESTYYDEKEDTWHECIIHRDLKPDNMLVTTTYGVKLTDFGEARVVDSEMTMTQVGSPVYMAPEVLRGERYDERVDVYSYGITLVEMLCIAEGVFELFEVAYKHMKGPTAVLTPIALTRMVALEQFRPNIPDSIFPALRKLIADCWSHDPNRRPGFDAILERLDSVVHDEVFPAIDEAFEFKTSRPNKPNRNLRKTAGRKKNDEAAANVMNSLNVSGHFDDPNRVDSEPEDENPNNRKFGSGAGLSVSLSPKSKSSPKSLTRSSMKRGNSDAVLSRGDEEEFDADQQEFDSDEKEMMESEEQQHTPKLMVSGRNRHLAKMMSVKRGGMMGNARQASHRGVAFAHDTSHDVGSPIMKNALLSEDDDDEDQTLSFRLRKKQNKKNVGFARVPEEAEIAPQIDAMKQRNELAKVKAENDAMKADMEIIKAAMEEKNKNAEASATQLKIAQKNARQARMDQHAKRKGGEEGQEGDDEVQAKLKVLEEALQSSNAAILKKEKEVQYYKNKADAAREGSNVRERGGEEENAEEKGNEKDDEDGYYGLASDSGTGVKNGTRGKVRKMTSAVLSLTPFSGKKEKDASERKSSIGGKNTTSLAAVEALKMQAKLASELGETELGKPTSADQSKRSTSVGGSRKTVAKVVADDEQP